MPEAPPPPLVLADPPPRLAEPIVLAAPEEESGFAWWPFALALLGATSAAGCFWWSRRA
ncbi:hypothetical protein GXW71_04875 [Roseomonas hellenica]|uniref:Uncharacterized protein n=1 Tax=Plastoroseomonas hellenica TaxID=2687306 RepID=A0ABS5ETS0_9PROT|nr:hypothetical protein [Plastoroseomonas hellenica]MBR0663686.1 hypothetical protein [Plastoroseomonas hellenica]